MTDAETQEIIERQVLPKDELDNFWDNVVGFVALFSLLVITKDNVVFLMLNILIIGYVFFLKLNEKNLKVIDSGLTKEENIAVLEKISRNEKWLLKTSTNGYYEYYIPFILGKPGHKLTIISIDEKIFFNLRNIGSTKGRMPYLFGIDTIKERKIINLFKNTAR